jgi:hypothetical protein
MSCTKQLSLDEVFEVSTFPINLNILNAIDKLATTSNIGDRGAIFTRIEVAEFILDLIGYNSDHNIYDKRILEPSFGNGDFLFPIIDRLLLSWKNYDGNINKIVEVLSNSIRAVELHHETFQNTKNLIVKRLVSYGILISDANQLSNSWLKQGDFLFEYQNENFDYVVGNPPYLRQEAISEPLIKEYRVRYKTMYDRADIYIAFIERSLSLLKKNGHLGFICSDRWMKNRYGGPLRNFVSMDYNLKVYVDMVGTDAFHTEVSAYPAITVISREKQGATRIAYKPALNKNTLKSLSEDFTSQRLSSASVKESFGIVNGSEPWLLESSAQLALLRKIESNYPILEEVGCKVGIGVATGADKVYIHDFDSLDIEEDRKLPLVTTKDIQSGEINWRGQAVVNTFNDTGGTVDLNCYPKLSNYLELNSETIRTRHIAKKNPINWFRTIDRVWAELSQIPKLLIPDIKGEAHIVYDAGQYYPHHNLYFITSDVWNLRALQAVLLSNITKLFIGNYSTKIRGGYLRFQAQYLRRIRIPKWEDVPEELRIALINAAEERNIDKCNKAVFILYGLNQEEWSALGGNGE